MFYIINAVGDQGETTSYLGDKNGIAWIQFKSLDVETAKMSC